jgi:hypothetical protein
MPLEDSMMKFMSTGLWLLAIALGLVLGVGALAQSTSTHDPGSQTALQNLLNQGFEVKAASVAGQGVQTLYLQKAALLYVCPLDVAGFACSRVVSR